MTTDPDAELLSPAEVAALFGVDPKTVTRWAKAGRLAHIRTLGGHRRYVAAQVRQLVQATRSPTLATAVTPGHGPSNTPQRRSHDRGDKEKT